MGKIPTFLAPQPTQIYYAPPVQAVQAPAPAPLAPLGQVFAQQSHPNQRAPNDQQGQAMEEQIANVLTKPLARMKFEYFKALLHFDQKSDGRHVGFSTLPCRMYDTLIFC